MAKLHYIGKIDHLVNFTCNSSIEELCVWFKGQSVVQFDTETNVTSSIADRELKVLQFGNVVGDEVFVVQWSFLNEEDKEKIRELLRLENIQKIAHNASFEYQICLKENIVLENVWDTMVIEKCLYPGYDYDLRFFALAAVLLRRYGIDVSKEQQGEFGDDIITDEKLIYAATDVVHLGKLKQDQRNDLIKEDLLQLAEGEYNENDVVLAFADMEFYGMGFNPEKWRTNIDKAEPIVKQATEDLTAILLQEPYYSLGQKLICNAKLTDSEKAERKVELPAILPQDMFTVNWNSSTQVLKILKLIWPNIEKASALELKRFLQDSDPLAPKTNEKGKPIGLTSKEFNSYLETPSKDWFLIIKLLLNKQYSVLEKALISNLKTQLIEAKFLLPKDTVTINWNSNTTKLEVFKWFNSNIENTDADTVEDNIHLPFFQSYKKYNNANSLLTKFGEKFIIEHVDSDGRVRTRYDTILSTGRVSSSSPNIQQIPKNSLPKDRQKDYRSCFIPGYEDWVMVDADYSSAELAILATLSGDEVFLDALSTGKDLHSVAAETVLKEKWYNAASEVYGIYPKKKDGTIDTKYKCEYYQLDGKGEIKKQKCECPLHQKMRQDQKKISFGIPYGLSSKGLAADLGISIEEADEKYDAFYAAFPKIKGTLEAFGNFGRMNGFIRTIAPFRRKRYFPYWKGEDTPKGLLGQIERASKNMPRMYGHLKLCENGER